MKKTLLLSLLLFMSAAYSWAQLAITKSGGWLETAYVEWTPDATADSYNVYYSGNGATDVKIDDQLIREYSTYYRADVVGISAGNYTLKIVPVIAEIEGTAVTSGTITVKAHDRSGFGFSNGIVPGAYKADGTPKANAVVLYITENTKNTVSLDVTNANSNPCIGLQTILEGFAKGDDNRPLIIRLVGQVTDMSYMSKGDIVIENSNNTSGYITLEGIGEDATADGWGIRLKNANNIEIRNIGTINCNSDEGDNIGLQQGNNYVWVHNCDFFYGDAGSDSDQAKGDGALDSKKSSYVTHSYNHFWDSGKCNLLGNGGEDVGTFSYHHNWYDHSDSRHPRVRQHTVHVYNNYFDGNAKYGIGATQACSIFAENNYFRNCNYPMLISQQGTDAAGDGTFSGDPAGMIKAYGNTIIGASAFIDQNTSATSFDAYVVANKTDVIASGVGSGYNNFDTDAGMYTYFLEPAEDAKATVLAYAGRMNGGDISFTFDNATEDANYAVIPALKSILTAYTTSVVSIQGDGEAIVDCDCTEPVEGDMVHNFTTAGTSSTFYTINGNLSTSKGTVTYGDLTLTQCLKIESSTSIAFTSEENNAALTIICNDGFAGSILIDDVIYNPINGALNIEVSAGSHTITKGDSGNIYYMSLVYPSASVNITNSEELFLFPNPVVNTLNITSKSQIEGVNVYSLSGSLIISEKTNTKLIGLSNLNAGSYIVVVNTNNGVYKQIIIKN